MRHVPALFILTACLAGCSTSSHVLVGTARPPIDPATVKLYLEPPPKYDIIAILDSTSEGSTAVTAQGKMNKAILKLKREAAKLGANGILLGATSHATSGSVGTGAATGQRGFVIGSGYQASIRHKTATGTAIFVP